MHRERHTLSDMVRDSRGLSQQAHWQRFLFHDRVISNQSAGVLQMCISTRRPDVCLCLACFRHRRALEGQEVRCSVPDPGQTRSS
jgi:hypothetical protein